MVFPYYRDGELLNHKYRTVKHKYFRLERDAELVLYGYDDIDPACTVIVEGEIDKLACEVAGLRNCRLGAERRTVRARQRQRDGQIRLP